MKNGKILIIDDNEDVLFALNLLLEPYVEQIKAGKKILLLGNHDKKKAYKGLFCRQDC